MHFIAMSYNVQVAMEGWNGQVFSYIVYNDLSFYLSMVSNGLLQRFPPICPCCVGQAFALWLLELSADIWYIGFHESRFFTKAPECNSSNVWRICEIMEFRQHDLNIMHRPQT